MEAILANGIARLNDLTAMFPARIDSSVGRTSSPTSRLIIFLLLTFALQLPTATAANEKTLTAFSWTPVDKKLKNIIPFHWLRREDMNDRAAMLQNAKRAADKMPQGKRALFSWNLHRTIAESPENVLRDKDGKVQGCVNKQGEFVNYRSIWWNAGADVVAQRMNDLLKDYKTIGGELDMLVLDFEQSNTYWHLYGMAQQFYANCGVEAYLEAIQQDPRYASLKARTGIENLVSITKWQENDDALKWDAAMHALLADQINRAVYAPLKMHYPKATLSNYDYYQFRLALPDMNNWNTKPFGPWYHVGTHQSRPFYGWLGQISKQKLDGKNLFEKTPFNALLFEVNQLRAMTPASETPIYPWIAFKGFSESLFKDNDYYQEMLIHLALHGIDQFLYWNPRGTTIPASAEDDKLVDKVLTALNTISRGAVFEIVNDSQLAWDANHILTCAKVKKDEICRFTPRLDTHEKVEAFVVGDNPAAFKIQGEDVVFNDLKILSSNAETSTTISDKGVWLTPR